MAHILQTIGFLYLHVLDMLSPEIFQDQEGQ